MSSVGRIIFASSLLGTGAIVYLVHSSQMAERARMYDGVLRDVERQERKKQQRSQQPSWCNHTSDLVMNPSRLASLSITASQ